LIEDFIPPKAKKLDTRSLLRDDFDTLAASSLAPIRPLARPPSAINTPPIHSAPICAWIERAQTWGDSGIPIAAKIACFKQVPII
jgi:hypothetical protein